MQIILLVKGEPLGVKEFKLLHKYIFDCTNLFTFLELHDITLSALLQFITGASAIPVLGFDEHLHITFVHGCPMKCKCYPTVSTCDLLLRLPVHLDAIEVMKNYFQSALKDGFAFGVI